MLFSVHSFSFDTSKPATTADDFSLFASLLSTIATLSSLSMFIELRPTLLRDVVVFGQDRCCTVVHYARLFPVFLTPLAAVQVQAGLGELPWPSPRHSSSSAASHEGRKALG